MFNITFFKSFILADLIRRPTDDQMEEIADRIGCYESDCNGIDGFFVFNGTFYSVEMDTMMVDMMSRLSQRVDAFIAHNPETLWAKPDRWFTDDKTGRTYAFQVLGESYVFVEFVEFVAS